jgi:hypothetical protein
VLLLALAGDGLERLQAIFDVGTGAAWLKVTRAAASFLCI